MILLTVPRFFRPVRAGGDKQIDNCAKYVVASCFQAFRGEHIQALVDEHCKRALAIPEGAGNSPRGLSPFSTDLGDFGAEGCVASAGRRCSCSETAVSGPHSRACGCDDTIVCTWGLRQVGSVRLDAQGRGKGLYIHETLLFERFETDPTRRGEDTCTQAALTAPAARRIFWWAWIQVACVCSSAALAVDSRKLSYNIAAACCPKKMFMGVQKTNRPNSQTSSKAARLLWTRLAPSPQPRQLLCKANQTSMLAGMANRDTKTLVSVVGATYSFIRFAGSSAYLDRPQPGGS